MQGVLNCYLVDKEECYLQLTMANILKHLKNGILPKECSLGKVSFPNHIYK